MRIQVLVATMQQKDYSLIKKMNITTDAIVGNQCERNSIETFEFDGHKVSYLNFAERGVGLNRNNALMRADADVVLFADDDMVYVDNYSTVVANAFHNFPQADIIIFNLKEQIPTRKVIKKKSRVRYLNYLRYGTARIAVKLSAVKKNAIYFNQCFGGGTEHSHGEDNLFLTECLKKGLKIYAVPDIIARLTEERESSWNMGYNEKYIEDQGDLYYAISKKWWKLLCLQDAIRRHKSYNRGWFETYLLMIRKKK